MQHLPLPLIRQQIELVLFKFDTGKVSHLINTEVVMNMPAQIPLAEFKTIYSVADVERAMEDSCSTGNEMLQAMYKGMKKSGGCVLLSNHLPQAGWTICMNHPLISAR
jgi:alpha-amylase/alpha-mannosidase (GH57 family)